MVFPITKAIIPPIMAADTESIAIIITKLESKIPEEELIKKFTLSDHRSPIKKPALAPESKVLMCAQRLKISANVKA